MALTQVSLSFLAQSLPGNFAIYEINNHQLKVLERSKTLAGLSGLDDDEYEAIIKNDSAAIVRKEDLPLVQRNLNQLITDKKENDFTYRIYHKTQRYIWIHVRAAYLGELESFPVVLAVFSTSASESREHSELLDNTNTLIYLVDKKTNEMLYANHTAQTVLGFGNYAESPCYRLIYGREKICPWCPIKEMNKGLYRNEDWVSPVKGQHFDLRCVDSEWYGREAVVFYSYDLTLQKKKEQKLELSKKTLEEIVDCVPVGLGAAVFKGDKIVDGAVNAKLTSILGFTEQDLLTKNPAFVLNVHPDDLPKVRQFLHGAFSGAVTKLEFRYKTPAEERYRSIKLETNPLKNGSGLTLFFSVEDVTKEKAAIASTIRNWKIYQSAVDAAELVAWEYDIKNEQILLTDTSQGQGLYRALGFKSASNPRPDLLLSFVAERSKKDYLALYDKVRKGVAHASADIWYQNKERHVRLCVRLSYTTILDENGCPAWAYGIAQDVTRSKLAEEKYEKAYQELDEAHPFTLGSYHLNLSKNTCNHGKGQTVKGWEDEGRPMSANENLAFFGQGIAEAKLKKDFLAFFTCKNLLKAFQKGQTRFSQELPFLFRDGTLRFVEANLFLLQNPKTNEIEGVTYVWDIDERKKKQAIIDHLTSKKFDYIAIIDAQKKTIEFQNKQPNITFGGFNKPAPYEEWRVYLEKNFLEEKEKKRYQEATSLERILSELADHDDYVFSYAQIFQNEKSRRQLQYSWLDKKLGLILSVRTDITMSYLQEQQQLQLTQAALAKAQSANAAKTEFVSRISHDIRTPISIIKNMTSFALEDIDDKVKLEDDLKKIEASDTFLLSLISDVLDISKIDSGKIELHPEPYLYDEYISAVRNMFGPLCEEKGIHLQIATPGAVPCVMADHIRLNQITLNLMSNAVKYTPKGGTIVFTTGSYALPDGKVKVHFEVKDTGIGMSEEFQRKMFDPFTQEIDNPYRSKASSGTGLGLAIVKRIVDLFHGEITVKSQVGKGSEIAVSFLTDIGKILPRGKSIDEEEKSELGDSHFPAKVLLAEDNEINTIIARRLLEGLGVKLEAVANGQEAIDAFKLSKPGEYFAILMDIQMPLVNGYEAAEKIRSLEREDAKSISIIAMTADAFKAAQDKSEAVGMDDYITKPLSQSALLEALLRARRKYLLTN